MLLWKSSLCSQSGLSPANTAYLGSCVVFLFLPLSDANQLLQKKLNFWFGGIANIPATERPVLENAVI